VRPKGVPTTAQRNIQSTGYSIWVEGAKRARLRDFYHAFLKMRWGWAFALIGLGFFTINLIFAMIYYLVGGIEGVAGGSFFDSLMFSVETLGTIGYGVMHPASHAASVVVIVESITGIITTSLITGLVFSKFSRSVGRFAFSTSAVVCMHQGKLTFMFRCGNERANTIIETRIHVIASITTLDDRGVAFYKMHDLKLVRDRIGGLRRGWVVMHVVDEASPLHGMDAAGAERAELELEIALMGFDDITLQTVHGTHQYSDKDVVFGHRLADTLTILDNGDMLFDLTKFNDTVPESAAGDVSAC
jgi:inward rectifier potassium channel